MAIPNDYIDKITNKDSGESRIISPAADKVRVDNENFEGTDLDEVLDEVAQAIGESGSGDGTVTGVKVGSTTYEPTDGVVDLSTPFGGKVDKNGTDSLMTAAEHTKLQNLPTNEQLIQQFGSKANDADVVKSISVNGQAQQKTNGNVNIVVPTITMDDVPTAGSNNAVKSGGIKTAIDNATPTIDPTTKKWIVGGQLTNIVAEGQDGQDGQDGNSGVASADGVESVNNLNGGTSDTAEKVYVLGANQGAVIKGILDKTYRSASTGDTSTVIVEVEHSLTAGVGQNKVGAAIVKGQRKPGTGGMNVLDTVNSGGVRATINTFFTRKGELAEGSIPITFPDKFIVRVPTGYLVDVVACNDINTNGTNNGVWESGFVEDGAEIDLMAVSPGTTAAEPGDKSYVTINFKRSDNGKVDNGNTNDTTALNSGFAIEWTSVEEQEIIGPAAGKAMEFLNADGSVAKTVYCKEDNAANVQVYTKAAVDEKIGSGGVQIGEGFDRTPYQVLTVHGLRHPIGYEGAQSSAAVGINTVKVSNHTTARATSHYFRIDGNDLVDMTLVDGGTSEAAATIKGAIKDGVIRFMVPDNIYFAMQHSALAGRASTAGVDYYGGAWRIPNNGIVDYDLDENDEIDYTDFPYIAINFKNADDSNFTDATAEAIGDNTFIVPLGTISVNGKNEQISVIGAEGSELSLFGDGTKRVEIPTLGKVEHMISSFDNTGIIARNKDAVERILAARKHYDLTHVSIYPVINHENNFCIAHGSDFHVDVDRLKNFRDFVDGVTSIDAAIITGDFTSNGTDAEFAAMMGVEFERVEPMRCIGNHDRDGGKTLEQVAAALDMDNDYYVNDDFVADYGIRFIVLNRYDVASTTKAIAQRDGHWSQTQIGWFIDKLEESITNGYNVIVAMHAIDNEVSYASIGKRTAPNDKGFWQRMNAHASDQSTKLTVSSGTVIEDIIAAFRTGGSISQPYTFSGNNAPQINVSHSFSGAGKFVCYMVGHCHVDMIGYAVKHPDQLYLAAPTSGCIGKDQSTPPQSYAVGTQVLDLPRVEGTKTEDCFNVYAFDTTNKIVKVVRVGADMNDLMEKREVAFYDYEPTLSND